MYSRIFTIHSFTFTLTFVKLTMKAVCVTVVPLGKCSLLISLKQWPPLTPGLGPGSGWLQTNQDQAALGQRSSWRTSGSSIAQVTSTASTVMDERETRGRRWHVLDEGRLDNSVLLALRKSVKHIPEATVLTLTSSRLKSEVSLWSQCKPVENVTYRLKRLWINELHFFLRDKGIVR